MKKSYALHFLVLFVMTFNSEPLCSLRTQARTARADIRPTLITFQFRNSPLAAQVLVQSPASTDADLQIICLFESAPENTLHGSLAEINQKLEGLLDQLRNPALFRGALGESVLIVPSTGTLPAKSLLVIGLGDSQAFTPQRMELVGTIAYREANSLAIAHPYFAPSVLDGGVARFAAGEIAENFMTGFLRAARTEKILQGVGASRGLFVKDLTYLAGPAHATDTKKGIEAALAASAR